MIPFVWPWITENMTALNCVRTDTLAVKKKETMNKKEGLLHKIKNSGYHWGRGREMFREGQRGLVEMVMLHVLH